MKKIILQQYFSSQINNGGPATCALLLINSFLKDKYIFKEMTEHFPGLTNLPKLIKYFYNTLRKEKPDIVHIRGVQSFGFACVFAAKLAKVKCVMSVDGLYIDCKYNNLKEKYIYYLIKYILEPYALRHADLTYCVSKDASEREFIKKHTKNLYGYIHNAAPDYDLTSKDIIRNNKRTNLNINPSEILLTYIGRITEDKGINILLDSFSNLCNKYNNIKLYLAGDGDLLPIIKKKYLNIIESGILILPGRIKDVKETLYASDIFVFPSFRENLPNSLLEASSAGVATISTNVGGNPEVIEDEKTGLLIPPKDPKALSNAIIRLIENESLRKSFANNAIKKMDSEFSQKKIFGQISKMYDSILDKD